MPEHVCIQPAVTDDILVDVRSVCLLMPPLWDLDGFVAVNPFVGFASMHIAQAARALADARGATMLPGAARMAAGLLREPDGARHLARAAQAVGCGEAHLRAMLEGSAARPMRRREPVLTLAERLDQEHGTRWEALVCEHAARCCADHSARFGSATAQPGALFTTWLEDSRLDHGLEIAGLGGFRRWVAKLPRTSETAIAAMLDRLEIPAWERQSYLYRLLHGVSGWASWLRRWAWERDHEDPGLVVDLLAMRMCLDAAVVELAERPPASSRRPAPLSSVEDEAFSIAVQDAAEDLLAESLANRFRAAPSEDGRERPAVQAVFCIDVRSERLRRHLEACSPAVETRGFAGFFGVSVEWHHEGRGTRRCPVLLNPGFRTEPDAGQTLQSPTSFLGTLLRAPASALVGVESLGLAALVRLLQAGFGRFRSVQADPEDSIPFDAALRRHLPLDARVEMAERILIGIGLHERMARVVLLCGHRGCSVNNPHAASLHCGACGGYGGSLNARMAATILNDAEVRAALALGGRTIPSDTVFVGGVHDTGSDEVSLLDLSSAPDSHVDELARLASWLGRASAATRAERAASLGAESDPSAASLTRRVLDWSQTRPEWALAGNAAFIAARRDRTRGVDLAGRAFLHEYDESLDADSSVLELILSAPMVVASWINLQYLASTVDPENFGAGDKNLLNRAGSAGVSRGDESDLRAGLPMQSVFDAHGRAVHEPVRLQVFVEASTERITGVLERQPAVRALVENGWVRLFAICPHGAAVARWKSGHGWEPFLGEEGTQQERKQAGVRGVPRGLDIPQQPRPRPAAPRQGS